LLTMTGPPAFFAALMAAASLAHGKQRRRDVHEVLMERHADVE
jgi:hypothetical protein